MTIFLIIIALLLGILGILGSVVPALPGPPLSWVGLLIMFFVGDTMGLTLLLVTLAIMLLITLLDYLAPSWFTRFGGGSKSASTGSLMGLVAGLFFFQPWGFIIGPFVGAFLGEYITDAKAGKALRVALLSFLGFLFTTGIKLAYTVVMFYYIIKFIP